MPKLSPQPPAPALKRLATLLRPHGRLAVLLSGGVDSSLLAAAAASALGPGRVLALTFASPLTPEEDLAAARSVAAQLGLRQAVLPYDALGIPEVAGNSPLRCYACKREVIRLAKEAAAAEGFRILAEGSNAGDMDGALRPGIRAVREAGILSPLAEAGLGKAAVRHLARALSLAVSERPSSPCLATRFPTGHRLTAAEVSLVAIAERELRALGLSVVRLRWRGVGEVALEVGEAELALAKSRRPAIEARLTALGLRLACAPLPYGQEKAPARGGGLV